ncbi:MAG: hypothetical protein OMM_03162 [Candidatus Magnetoglobus multicellularis str. Araruama]|uniref:Cohesin domain-containing protein n=1 Tax=Candidatus Magnetoglobus multicellularis str. Araruama TaxID=890399 RepID=A0A1V1P6Z2_9BACT|nr:MAG: hypothetical protein OMM_03162 [Candidatus Magnetoglobus multicellularis str. Araruama]
MDYPNHIKKPNCIQAIIVILFLFIKCGIASSASVFMVAHDTSGSELTIEIFANVGLEYLGSYDLVINFNPCALQFKSIRSGNTLGHISAPKYIVDERVLKVSGIYKNPPKDEVSVLIITFQASSGCLSLPFDLFVFELLNTDRELPVDVIGFEITDAAIKRLQTKQHDYLPLVDEDTIELIKPLVGIRFDNKDHFVARLIETIGEQKTNQYQSDIITFSRLATQKNFSMNCLDLHDILDCLKYLTGHENATCSDITGDAHIGIDDVITLFQQVASLPDR